MIFGWGMALAISTIACGGRNQVSDGDANRAGQPAPAGTAAKDQPRSPVTLTGCLQKGDGRSDYILTEVNTTRTTVGTSGSPASGSGGDPVGREQMRSAAHAYRLKGDRDALEPLVGKQVRLSGTLAERSDLNDHTSGGTMKDKDRTKIDEDDLAKVDVTSIDSVADNCGGTSSRK
jgi:hypothetical protein